MVGVIAIVRVLGVTVQSKSTSKIRNLSVLLMKRTCKSKQQSDSYSEADWAYVDMHA